MSVGKELRERFSQEKDTPTPSFEVVSQVLGITTEDMEEIIISDISAMLQKDYQSALEGYIFCLSRIIDHKRAWGYITQAFSSQGGKVPTKYYKQFGQTQPSETEHKNRVTI